jgi:hypothetical protein
MRRRFELRQQSIKRSVVKAMIRHVMAILLTEYLVETPPGNRL